MCPVHRSLAPYLLAAGLAAAEGLVSHPVRVRGSGEVIGLRDSEHLGLAGLHVDSLESCPWFPGTWVGLGGYGAAGGDRGGLFVLGVSAGWRARIVGPVGVDIGGFAGGGGGADAGQGDGLMLRGEALVTVAFGPIEVAGGIARIDFPGGAIAATAATVGLRFTDHLTLLGEGSDRAPVLDRGAWTVAPGAVAVWPRDAVGRSGAELADRVDLVGIDATRQLGHGWGLDLHLAGAADGEAAGYMEVLGGPVWRGSTRIHPCLRLLGGLGGGGDIDTGGGWLLRPEVGIGLDLGAGLGVGVLAEVTWAPDGDVLGPSASLALAWTSEQWELRHDLGVVAGRLPAEGWREDRWRLAIGDTAYRIDPDRDEDIHLIDVLVGKPLTAWLVLTGRARSAWDGGVGGYSEGLFGLRGELPLPGGLRIGIGGEVGAGGGGGMPAGGGAITAVTGILAWSATPAWGIEAQAGRIEAVDGDLRADLVGLALVWSFGRALVD